MEQFTSDALKHSPPPNLSFQNDKFMRKSNLLSIPDTIHEQAEISGDSTKMEASENLTKIFNCDEKENNQLVIGNESSDNSKIIAIDNSFIKNCERRLLENSNNDEEKTSEFQNKSAVNKQLLDIPSRLVYNNETISTPPSALRKEISLLRNELAAADEFHDLEIQVLKEEKLHSELDLKDYLQVVEKNAALIELYTNLKNEFEEYRKEQERMRSELQSKTADCLESLCSQIEASDNSLNFSNASLMSFNAGIRSSTMLDHISEVEATVMHDATVLTSDPLAITLDGTFKTPSQTPLRSARKLLPQQINWASKISDANEVNEILGKSHFTMPVDAKYNIQLLNLEATLDEKLKKVDSLEERLFKVEDISSVIQSDCERTKEILLKKTEQLTELTQKLFTETISLNPALRDSLIDAPGPKLLAVFIETIMEKCKNVQDELIMKHNSEKAEWEAQTKTELTAIENLQNQIKTLNEQLSSGEARMADLEDSKLILEKKLTDAEALILTREVEMRILQTNIREAREEFTSSAEALLKLESQLSLIQTEKKQVESQCQELEDTVRSLKNELELKEKLLIELDTAKSTVTNIQKENEALKQIIQNSEETIAQIRMESAQNKNELLQEIQWLKNKEESRFNTLLQSLEDLKKTVGDSSCESTALKSFSEKLQECGDPQLLSAVEAVMEFAKMDFDSQRKSDLIEAENLRNQINEKSIDFETKLSAMVAENSEFSKLCEDLKKQLLEAENIISLRGEEIMVLKREQNVLNKLKEDLAVLEETEANDCLADRIGKLITEIPEQKDAETGETRIVSTCVEILSKTCKGVQNEFIKKIECNKLEWESQRNADLDLIQTLQVEVKSLAEKNRDQEVELCRINVEKEDLKKLHDNLVQEMSKAEALVSDHKKEIENLRCHEMTLKQTKEELAFANETILTLKSRMTSIETVKTEMETRCQELQETGDELKRMIDANANLRSAMDAIKSELEQVQKQNEELREMNKQSSELIDSLKAQCEHNAKEEKESLGGQEESRFRVLLEILEEGKTKLKEMVPSTENYALGLISEKLRESLDSQLLLAVEAIADFMKIEFDNKRDRDLTHMENLQNQIKILTEKNSELEMQLNKIINENMEFKNLYENLKIQLQESETRLSLREEEITILKKQEEVLQEMKDALALADETISKLNNQLSLIEEEKKQVENQCQELEDIVVRLKNELESKEKLLIELDTVKSTVTNIQKENEQVENQCQELEDTVRSLKNELELKQIELDTAKSTVANIQKENEALKQIIQNSEEAMGQIKIESVKNENELLKEIEGLKSKAASRFDILFHGLEDLKKTVEDPSSENTALKSFSEKLQECGDPQLLSAVEAVMEFAKIDFDSQRKSDLSEAENLRNQINEKSIEFETKLSAMVAENSEFSKLCEDLKKQLLEAENIISLRGEEIMVLKREQNVLNKLKEDLTLLEETEANDCLADRIEKLITEIPEQKDTEAGETRIVSTCVEILSKTCKGVQNEFIKKIECKKLEWESQRNADLDLIQTLQVEVKSLSEKSRDQEVEICRINVEKEDLKKLHDNLVQEMSEAEALMSNHKKEIENLRCHEVTLKQTKEDLAVANETILTLKSQMTSIEALKTEMETRCQGLQERNDELKSQLVSSESERKTTELRCRKLEDGAVNLQEEIQTKEVIIKGLDEMKEKMEKENIELRRKILQSDDTILHLKRGLESAKEDQKSNESRVKDLLNDIESLKKGKENLTDLTEKIEKLEKTNRNMMEIFSDVQSHLDLPEDTMTELLSGKSENKNVFREKINSLVKTHAEELRAENKNLKLNNKNLKEKVQQMTKVLCESANVEMKEQLNGSQPTAMTLRSRSNKNIDLFVRRLDKVEDLNHNLTELLTEILTLMEYPDLEKLSLTGAKNFSALSKKLVSHVKSFAAKLKELKEENAQLDEECDMYSNIIKNLKKEATAHEEKTKDMQSKISGLEEEKAFWEKERQQLLAKISKMEDEYQQLKSAPRTDDKFAGPPPNWNSMSESKKVNDLKRAILIREQKLLELQDLEAQTSSFKTQIEYLKGALEREKKKVAEEKEKNKKLHNELNEATKNQKSSDGKKEEHNEVLEELRMRGSLNGGVVQEFVDKEKMRKLSKDIGILKELCRARYKEIKRLEALNASLRNRTPKNSNQMDSPIRTRGCNTRSKSGVRDTWKTESTGKENSLTHAEHLY